MREILRELDNKLTEQDLNDIIEDIDVDDSGKIDFEDFKGLMLWTFFFFVLSYFFLLFLRSKEHQICLIN